MDTRDRLVYHAVREPLARPHQVRERYRAAAVLAAMWLIACGGTDTNGPAGEAGGAAGDAHRASPVQAGQPAIPCEQTDLDYEQRVHAIANGYRSCTVDEDCAHVDVPLSCPTRAISLVPCGPAVAAKDAAAFLEAVRGATVAELCVADRAPCTVGAGCACYVPSCVEGACASVPASSCE